MLLQCLHYFRQNALDFNVQGRNEHTPLYVTAVEYFIVLDYNVHDSSVLACSVIIIRDKSEYVCNLAVLKCTYPWFLKKNECNTFLIDQPKLFRVDDTKSP